MAMDNKNSPDSSNPLGFVINEKGEEIPITDEMVSRSMDEVKLHSIGAHTGRHKIITDDMLEKNKK